MYFNEKARQKKFNYIKAEIDCKYSKHEGAVQMTSI